MMPDSRVPSSSQSLDATETLLEYRIGRVEADLKEINRRLEQHAGGVAQGLSGIASQLATYESFAVDRFVDQKRYEADSRSEVDRDARDRKLIEDRMTRLEAIVNRGLLAILGASIMAAFAMLETILRFVLHLS